jgi:hypothetical protein
MTSMTDYFTDNSTDYMYGETFYGRHTEGYKEVSHLTPVDQLLEK